MPMTYAVMKVATTDSKAFTTNYSASIQGRQDIDIYPQVSGFLERLCVSEGDQVRKGQVLFVIDQVPYRAALNTAIANVKAAQASLNSWRISCKKPWPMGGMCWYSHNLLGCLIKLPPF